MLLGEQLRAARAILQWRALDLAERAGVGISTIQRAEKVNGPIPMIPANEKAIRAVLEAAGIRFTDEGCVCVSREREPSR
jgi:transcriptional regulator with XRE-family HTH domain